VPESLTDLAGLRVSAEDFLAAVLDAAQPIWVVDPDDVIRFANPARSRRWAMTEGGSACAGSPASRSSRRR
jgi:hypothetical protein